MKQSNKSKSPASPSDSWQAFIQSELKSPSKLGKAFEKAGFGGCEDRTLTLYFEDEAIAKTAKGQIIPLTKKLVESLACDRVEIKIGNVPQRTSIPQTITTPKSGKFAAPINPLQALNFAEFGEDRKGAELAQPVLIAAANAEKTNTALYTKLKQRTESLIGTDGVTILATFNWRLRVGGTRGFRELLLPVFHPVFGVPYLPSSSLKGAARAWARGHGTPDEVKKILGMLEGKIAKAAKVEFLDAFPLKPCLSVDVATPQWQWQGDDAKYKPEPHPLLSMEQPEILIGLRPTRPEYAKYLPLVKEWLENALKVGIGSRVSSGYGKALGQITALPHSKSWEFELWTQGLYGSEPPSKENHYQGQVEFRPTAVRGILRYWFRSIAMNLYPASRAKDLEDVVFGKLSQPGQSSISVRSNPPSTQDPYHYTGRIILEAKEQKYLNVLEQLLLLASSLGGFGRGSRRPLHLLDGKMRGCDWTVGEQLAFDRQQWTTLIENVKTAFQAIDPNLGSHNISPGEPRSRHQDVLDANAQIWLVKSLGQLAPSQVQDWRSTGSSDKVRGAALTLMYGDDRFKGERLSQGSTIGNSRVGGALGTPSFVWIKSIFPRSGDPYQVVTIFGINQPDRLIFAQELDKLSQRNPAQVMLVYGSMLTNRPTRR